MKIPGKLNLVYSEMLRCFNWSRPAWEKRDNDVGTTTFKTSYNAAKLLLLEGRKSIILSEGSQALPTRPSEYNRMKLKTLECLEAVASARAAEYQFYELMSKFTIWKNNFGAFDSNWAKFWWI